MNRELISTCRVWVSGSTFVVTIPRDVRDIKGVEKGDRIVVKWEDLIKRDELISQTRENKVRKTDEKKYIEKAKKLKRNKMINNSEKEELRGELPKL